MSCRPVLLVLLGSLAFCAPASASQSIEGTWNFQGGRVLVEPSSTGFKGTVVDPTTFSYCQHPKGEQIWALNGTGDNYSGTHLWYRSDCSANPGGQSTWRIIDTDPQNFRLIFCTRRPGTGAPNPGDTPDKHASGTYCYELLRAKPPTSGGGSGTTTGGGGSSGSGSQGGDATSPSQTSSLTSSDLALPARRACGSRSLRVRIPAAVRRNARSLSFYVNAKRVKRISGRKLPKTKTTRLRNLPGRAFRLRMVAVTKRGKQVKRTKRYSAC